MLDPDVFASSKTKATKAKTKMFEDVPCQLKIKNKKSVKQAIELIETMFAKFGLEKGEQQNRRYYKPYESTADLVEKKLIKEYYVRQKYDDFVNKANKKNAESEKKQTAGEDAEKPKTKKAKQRVVPTPEELEEEKEQLMEEIAESQRKMVFAAEVDSLVSDELAETFIEDKHKEAIYVPEKATGSKPSTDLLGKKGIINIDTLSVNFEENDLVTLDILKEKGLVDKKVSEIKVLARGMLTKPLHVVANDYSIEAVKMIILIGGKATKI
jgi:hypothetical protein